MGGWYRRRTDLDGPLWSKVVTHRRFDEPIDKWSMLVRGSKEHAGEDRISGHACDALDDGGHDFPLHVNFARSLLLFTRTRARMD